MQTVQSEKVVLLQEGSVTTPRGFTAGGMHCGLKKRKLDLGYIYSTVPATAAGVYATNRFQAAPLTLTQKSIEEEHKLQAFLVNSGNANAFTGEEGFINAAEMQSEFARKLGCKTNYVGVTSTGVIGVQLPMDKITLGIEQLLNEQHLGVDRFEQAILTTDTCVKKVAVQMVIDGKTVSIGGAAKGSGMIHPNMATMLGFVTTDALIDYPNLLDALKQVTDSTFNMITVDGDTSTNDMVVVLANGEADNQLLTKNHREWNRFVEGLRLVCETLAKKIASDGEGATKLVEVTVTGAKEVKIAREIAKAIISSNLVKTAIYGTDPNWGRIVCAMGYSGADFAPDLFSIDIGPYRVVENGVPYAMDEAEVKAYLGNEQIQITVNLYQGDKRATAWGCDLTYDYVRINASYRT